MMADDFANLAVKQHCRIGVNAQQISSRTGSYFKYKKLKQLFLCTLF